MTTGIVLMSDVEITAETDAAFDTRQNALLNDYREQVRCLRIPLNELNLLLPNACVAEVARMTDIDAVEETPRWLLGMMSWRELSIPVISFEKLAYAEKPLPENYSRVCVLNAPNSVPGVPFIGLCSTGIPHLSVASESQVAPGAYTENAHREYGVAVHFNGEELLVPDIEYMETSVMQALRR